MNKFEESKFIQSIQNVSFKVSQNAFLNAIKNAFVLIMPLIIIGSFATLISWIRFDYNHFFDGKDAYVQFMTRIFGEHWSMPLDSIQHGTSKVISILIATFLAYFYADGLKSKMKLIKVAPLTAAVLAFAVFWVSIPQAEVFLSPLAKGPDGNYVTGHYIDPTYFEATSLFLAIILAVFSTRVYVWFVKKDFTIKMPEGVPTGIAQSFASLIPGIVILLTVAITSSIFINVLHFKSLNEFIYLTLQKPLSAIGISYPAIILAEFVRQFLWLLGIHGFAIINGSINNTLWLPTLLENIATFAKTHDPYHFAKIAPDFINTYGMIGGSGSTLGLLISIPIVAKRSPRLMQIFKIGILPGLFNINEPVIFGLPIVLSPIYALPFIFVPILNDTLSYILITLHWLPQTYVLNSGAEPILVNVALTTGFKYIVPVLFYAGLIVVNTLIYMPFVKADYNMELKQKKQNEDNNKKQTELVN